MGLFTTQRGTAWEIIRQQRAYNALKPNGTSALNWYLMGRRGTVWSAPNFDTVQGWGQIYKAEGATVSSDVAVKFGHNFKTWTLSLATGLWTKIQDADRVQGALYPEDYVAASTAWTAKSNAPAPMIAEMVAGRILHFWPDPRVAITPSDVLAIGVVYEAKIISKSGANISGEVGTLIGASGPDLWADGSISTGNNDGIVSSHLPLQPYYQRFRSIVTNGASDWALLKTYGAPTGFEQLTDTSYTPGVDADYVP